MTAPILASLTVMLVSLVGVLFVWKRAGTLVERNLSILVSFSAGVFLVISYKLAIEAAEHSSVGVGLLFVLVGSLLVLVFFKLLPAFHHHHEEGVEERAHSKLDAKAILFGDALHNMGDGVLLAAAFATSSFLGIVATVNILIHELVQEVSEFFVLRQAGYSAKKALTVNFFISATVLVGALGGFFFLDKFEGFEAPILGIASGSFLVVVFHDLIPHSVRISKRRKTYIKNLTYFAIGISLMVGVNILTGH